MRKSILLTLSALAVVGSLNSLAAQTDQQKPAKAQPPAALPLARVAFPPFVERTLNQGAQLLVVQNHEQPVVSINIYIKGAGQTADSDAKPGVAAATATLIDAGTATRTSKQIAETVEGLGANLSTSASHEWATISATMLKTDIDQVLSVVADVLLNPAFPEDEVETERTRALTDLQVSLSRPATLAQRQFEASVFGKHPYGRLTTTSALRSITRADLVAFHQTHYKPSNALIVVAGDVEPGEIRAAIEKHLGGWTGKGPARPEFAAAPAAKQREIVLVNKPGAVQAAFRIGHTIVPATHPDWPALTVAQQVLGGSSNAWLNDNLREKKGFTYGAYAQSAQRLDPGFFVMWGDVRNEVADSALELFLALGQRLKNEPVPAADLELAKSWLTGNFPLTIETPSQIAGQVASSRLLGQPRDHVETWRTRIAAVTAADVQRVATAHLRPETAVIVVSGDASVLTPKLEKFGKLTVVDEEGHPVAETKASGAPAPSGLDGSSIQPHELTYSTTYQGTKVSELTRTIARESSDGKDVVKATSAAAGMISGSSELLFDATTFAPVSSTVSQLAGGQEIRWLLRVADGKVSGTLSMPGSEDKAIDAVFTEGTLLPGMDEFALWVSDFAAGKELTFSSFDPMSGAVVPISVRVTGESKQTVAAGEFDVYDVEMKTAQGAMKVHVRKAAPHIVIKQEFLVQPVVIELTSAR